MANTSVSRRLSLLIGCLGIFLISVLPVSATGPISYQYSYGGDGNTYTNYFLQNSYPYSIYIWWQITVGDRDRMESCTEPRFQIQYYSNGTATQSIVYEAFHNSTRSGCFLLPANTGICVTVYTGHWHHRYYHNLSYHNDYGGFDCSYTITYQPDEVAPNSPGIPAIIDNGDGHVYQSAGISYTNYQPVPLTWKAAQDNPSIYNGVEIKSDIKEYILDINNLEQSQTYGTNQCSLATLAQGENKIKVKARDKAGNIGSFSEELTLFVDQIAPSIPGAPTTVNQNGYTHAANLTWTWDASSDTTPGSGLKGYQVYVVKDDGTVAVDWVSTTTNSYSQESIDGAGYTCKVRAIDNVGNLSYESIPVTVKVDRSVPQVSLTEYPLHQSGNQLSLSWNTVIDTGSGLKNYEVALTSTAIAPDDTQAQVLENTTTSATQYTFATKINSKGKYYAWVRGIDQLGNRGVWQGTVAFPKYSITGPANGEYIGSKLTVGIHSTDSVSLKFRAGYQLSGDNSTVQYSNYDTSTVTVNLTQGTWKWWLEIYEGNDAAPQITESFKVTVDTTPPPSESNTFVIKATSGGQIYDTTNYPTNIRNVSITNLNLIDNPGGSGIKGIYLWNGTETTPPVNATYKALADISTAIPWTLADGEDGIRTVTMQVVDNAGNSTLVTYQVLLDTTLPAALDPKKITHTTTDSQIAFQWQASDAGNDIAQFQGQYTLPDGTVKEFQVTASNDGNNTATGSLTVPVSGYGPNQPVVLTVASVDKAGNQSTPASYTAYTKAALGSLQNLDGGYDPNLQQFYLSWQISDTVSTGADKYILEYGTQDTNTETFTVQATLSPVSGIFTHSGLAAHGNYSYRLVTLNSSGDRTEGKVFSRPLPNTPPTIAELKSPLSFARGKAVFTFTPSTDADGDNILYNLYLKAADDNDYQEYLNVISGYEVDGLIHGKNYEWYIEADDTYNTTKGNPGTFTVDTLSPILGIESARYTYTNQSQLTITTSDALSGIDKVSYTKISATDNTTLDSGTISLADNGSGKQSGVIALSEGNYHLHFTAFDKAGNSTAAEVNNLKVDQTQPILEGVQLELDRDGSCYLSSGKLPISFSATDSAGSIASGISVMRYWILNDRNGDLGAGKTISLSSNLQQFSQNLALSGTDGGEYYLALAVEDTAGNRSAVQYFGPIKLDTSAPEASLSLTGMTAYGSSLYLADSNNLTATCTAKDDQSGIAGTLFAILNSVNGEAVSAWGTTWESVKATTLTPGASYRVAAKVTNKAGLVTEVNSEKFIYDPSEPQNLILGGPTTEVTSGEQVTFTANATEPESAIVQYRLAITSSDGVNITTAAAGNQDGWLVQSSNQFRFELPSAADGSYTATVEAVNAAGLKSSTSMTLIINNSQEKVLVSDQGPYTGFSDKLSGWWKYIGTKTVNGYQYRIINTAGEAKTNWIVTNDTQVTATGLSLESGKEYRFEIQANLSDGSALTGTSAGVTIDTTVPVINSLVTPTYSTSENLAFTWGATDNESGIVKTWVALGSSYYQTDITGGWVEVDSASSTLTRDVNGKLLNLTNGQSYYLTLRVSNGAGLETEKAAPGVIINNAAPPTPVVTDQGDYINPAKQPLKANWIWTPFDVSSGKVTYQWALIPYGTNTTSVTWTDVDQTTEVSVNRPDLTDGVSYYFAVKATNQAGLSSIGTSDGIMIDKNAPIIPEITLNQAISLGESKAATYITSTKDLTLSINSYDVNGITVYQYTYGSQSDISGDTNYDSSTESSFTVNPSVSSEQVTVYKAVCSDGATNLSQAGYSTGVILDSGAPKITSVNGSVSGNTLIFDWDVIASTSPVVSYEYALVPEAQMNATPGNWTSVQLNRSISIDATGLADGKYRLLVRGLNAAGTYSRRSNDEWGVSPGIILDREPPVMDGNQFIYPVFANYQIAVTAAAADALSGIGGYQYALGTKTNPTVYSNGWVDVAGTTGSIQFNVPCDGVAHNSLVYLMVRAKDKVGLWSTALVSPKILIDHTLPTTPVVTFGAYSTSKSQLTGIQLASSDPESGITHYRLGIVAAPGQEWQSLQQASIDQFDGTLTYLDLTEGQVIYIAAQTCNGAGEWSEVGYSRAVSVDTIAPVLEFTNAGSTIVLNTPPINIEYTLSEAANVQFTLSAADGTAETSTASGVTGAGSFLFNQSTPQTYQLTALPVDPAGNIGAAKVQSIRVNAPPQITLTALSATPGAVVLFNAAVSDPDGHPVSYSWDAGDGSPVLSGVAVTHQYAKTGTYTLQLTVIDNDGGVAVATTKVSVGNTNHGTLYTDETWSGTHYIYGDVTVPAGITLTIAPGTQVIVDGTLGSEYTLDVKGTLNIPSGGQIFASSSGRAGSWKGIYLEGGAALDGVTIKDAERGLTVVSGATATLSNCIFQNNQVGLHVYGTTPAVNGCSFLSNTLYGIKEDEGGRPVVTGCTFTGNGMDYYSETDTDLTIEELNQISGNSGNK